MKPIDDVLPDYYEILQISPSAEPEVIQAAYGRLARKYHPDRSPHPAATQRMAELNAAYEVLSDPTRRRAYDRSRSALSTRDQPLLPSHRGPGFAQHLRAWLHELAVEPFRLDREALGLIVLSILDLLITVTLLRRSGVFYQEANPIALWWFARWNVAGLTVFKFGLVAVGIAASELVERRRPGVGRAILRLGCLAAAGVVVYGVALGLRHGGE